MAKERASRKRVEYERVSMQVPYCKVILRNMMKDEHGASFLYNNKHVDIESGKEVELKKEIVDHLKNLVTRKSRFEHTPGSTGSGTKIYYDEPRYIMEVLETYDKEETVKVRKDRK